MENRPALPECDNLLQRLFKRLSPASKAAFLWTFLLGMLIHLYMFTGKYPNHDELLNLYSANHAEGFGRWFAYYAAYLSSNASLPLVTGIISILALSLSCVLVVKLLHIERRTSVFLTALTMVSFPAVANTFTWMHAADTIFIALLFAVLAAYLTDRYQWGFIAGAALVILSLMTYQAQVCVTIALMAVRYLQLLLDKKHTDREMLLLLARYAAALLVGVAVYILLARFVLPALTGQELYDHAGLDTMGALSLADIPGRIFAAYYEFAQYLLRTSMIVTRRFVRYAHLLIGGLEVAFVLLILFRTKVKSALQTIFALLILLLLPMLFNSIYLMGVTDYSTIYLLIYSYTLFYILLLVLYEALQRSYAEAPAAKARWLPNATSYAVVMLTLVMGVTNAVNSNEIYFTLQLKYENCYALSNRVVQSVEQYPGYTVDTPVYVAGSFAMGNYLASKETAFKSISRHSGLQSVSEYNLIATDKHFHLFVENFIGVLLTTAEQEQKEALLASDALKEMPCYPYDGSLAIIDGVLVVKASTTY